MENPMARNTSKSNGTVVATVYDKRQGIYVATRKDGSVTFGHFNQKGTNVRLSR
jgi:hypothetical protein